MRVAACSKQLRRRCRQLSTSATVQQVAVLPDSELATFRQAYIVGEPVLLPRGALDSLPAIRKWFKTVNERTHLNASYLARSGSTPVPLEFSNGITFARIEQPLSYFLECIAAAGAVYTYEPSRFFSSHVPGRRAVHRTTKNNNFFNAIAPTTPKVQIYLAQAPIANLPRALRADLPTPSLILEVDKGDVYDSSIWLGQPPTYTPLHRDPNPNLFVQLAGAKKVRLYKPSVGRAIFSRVQEMISSDSGQAIRGEEMMQGAERAALDAEVWGEGSESTHQAYEAELEKGDALFIPKGWWHSIKSVGESDINGSVNWWFR